MGPLPLGWATCVLGTHPALCIDPPHSLKSGAWKSIQDLPLKGLVFDSQGVLLQRALDWLTLQETYGERMLNILTFDLASEEFCKFPLPVHIFPAPISDPVHNGKPLLLSSCGKMVLLEKNYSRLVGTIYRMERAKWFEVLSLNLFAQLFVRRASIFLEVRRRCTMSEDVLKSRIDLLFLPKLGMGRGKLTRTRCAVLMS
ncbi:unnamed protein product [Prunus armeniaca]